MSKTFLLAELLTRYQCFTALTKYCSFPCVTLSNWEPLHNSCTSCVIVRLTYFLVWHDFLPISLLYLLLCISRPILTVAIVRIPYYLKCWLDSCMEGYCSHCSVLFYYDMWLCRIKSLRVVIHHSIPHQFHWPKKYDTDYLNSNLQNVWKRVLILRLEYNEKTQWRKQKCFCQSWIKIVELLLRNEI